MVLHIVGKSPYTHKHENDENGKYGFRVIKSGESDRAKGRRERENNELVQ